MTSYRKMSELSRISNISRMTLNEISENFVESTLKIKRIEITTGKYLGKFTAVGTITIRYSQSAPCSYGLSATLTDLKTNLIDLTDEEQIESIKTFRNFGGDFLCGIAIKTSKNRNYGTFGRESKIFNVIKSPYKNGYFISAIFARGDDVIRDLQAHFSSTYASPFVQSVTRTRKNSIDSNFESSKEFSDNSIEDIEETQLIPRPNFVKIEQTQEKSYFRVKKVPPTPPPRFGLTSFKPEQIKLQKRKSSIGSLLTNRPILSSN